MMNGPSWQIAQVGSSVKNTFSFRSICPHASITGNPYHHHPYHLELSLLVFTIIVFPNRTVQFSSCRSKPAGNRFTACLGIFPTTWIPEQEDWRMAKLLFRYCPLKGNPNASPPSPQMQLFAPRLRTTWGSLSLSFAALVPRRVQLSQGRQPVVEVIWY